MEKSEEKNWNIENEEDLYVKFKEIYEKLWKDNFFIEQKESIQMLKRLSVVEMKAREYGVVSPNEEIEGFIIYFLKSNRNEIR